MTFPNFQMLSTRWYRDNGKKQRFLTDGTAEALKEFVRYCFLSNRPNRWELVVFCFNLEIALRMVANGTLLGSFLAYDNVTTVGALPNDIAVF